ncbi:MAG: FKBP-type peptidyl-prolyl cis-trans isomerase [Planctomycetota bacterium]
MTKRLLLPVTIAFGIGLVAGRLPAQDGAPKPADDAAGAKTRGYAVGYFIGAQRGRGLKDYVDATEAGRGFADAIRGASTMSDEQREDALFDLQSVMIKKEVPAGQQEQELRRAKAEYDKRVAARKDKQVGIDFLTANEKKEGVKKTASGLQYKVLKEGEGPQPKPTDTVTVHYTGKLIDGKVFDSSVQRGQPTSFPLNRVIPGWTEGLQLMKVGAKYELYVPYQLAYGPEGRPPTIPAYATLVFEVELLKIGE